jgi:ABC-2 type transport system permease protein
MRNSTGAIFTLVAILFVLPMIVSIAGAFQATEWIATAGEYLPAEAGGQLLAATTAPDALTPWQGYGVLAAWTAAALVAGIVMTRRRDA